MIVLPRFPRPNRMSMTYLDFGFDQQGASDLRVDRPGNRHIITLSWPRETMQPNDVQLFLSRLKRGKRQGVQIEVPLLAPQGNPGTPVVDGAGQSGTTLNVRGLIPDYVARTDYLFTLVDAAGVGYLHSIYEPVRSSASGTASWQIEPPLRAPFADGAAIHLARPFIQGALVGETFSYSVEEQKRVPLTITIRERK